MRNEEELYLGIDEHSFKHQELVHTVTEVKQRKVVGILKDDRIATLKEFLGKIPKDKVKEVWALIQNCAQDYARPVSQISPIFWATISL
jgi:transposase